GYFVCTYSCFSSALLPFIRNGDADRLRRVDMKQTADLMLILVIMAGCSSQETKEKEELFISAAASVARAMDELVHVFTKEFPDVDVTTYFASSGQLSRQIQQGAPVDIFLSAEQTWMDTLEDQGRIFSKTRSDFAANQLVMIAKKENTATSDNLDALAQNSRDQIAIGKIGRAQ